MSEPKTIDFFEFSNDMLCVANGQGYLTRVNLAWTRALGWSAKELTSRPYVDFVHPDDLEKTIKEAQRLNEGHETIQFENRYRCRDGTYRWLAWRAKVVPASDYVVATARDVTEQKQQTEALREAEARFRTVATHAPVGIAQADAAGNVFFVNDNWCKLADVAPEQTMSLDWQKHVHPEDLPGLVAAWQSALQAGRPMPPYEFRFLHTGGATRWASGSMTPLVGGESGVVGQIATVQDITDRKLAEHALRQSEARFRELATHGTVGIVEADAQGRCTFVNRRWCEMAGISYDEALGDGWRAAMHPDDLDRVESDWRQSVQADRDYVGECRFFKAGGEIVWVSFHVAAVRGDDGLPRTYVTSVVDVTPYKLAMQKLDAEQALLRQSIELADREHELIAYEIHDGMIQYAAGALLHLEGYKSTLTRPDAAAQLDAVSQALKQAIAEGRRVMNGIRTPVLNHHGVVAAIEELVGERSTSKVAVEFIPPRRELGRLASELEISLYRMTQESLTNAIKHSRSPKVRIALSNDDPWVRLEIKDWGVGIVEQEPSRGVHGLSGIRERVRLLGGEFKLKSGPNEGTEIRIAVPLRRREPKPNSSK